jgi:Polysaccharide lyase
VSKLVAFLLALSALVFAPTASAWQTGFETSLATWNAILAERGDVARVDKSWAAGRYVLRSQVAAGSCPLSTDVLPGGGCKRQRAQLKKSVGERPGVNSWWKFDVRWPTNYQPALRAFNVFMQWHGRGPFAGQGANLSFRLDRATRPPQGVNPHVIVSGCSYRQTCGRTIDLPRLAKGRWHTFKLHVRWSTGSTGLVEVWVNGRRAGRASGPNVFRDVEGPDVWMQAGIYRGDSNHTATVYYDSVRHGHRARAVRG